MIFLKDIWKYGFQLKKNNTSALLVRAVFRFFEKHFFFKRSAFTSFFVLSTTDKINRSADRIYQNDILYVSKLSIDKCIFSPFYAIILLTISRYRDIMQVKGEIIRCLYYQDFTELLFVCIFSSHNTIHRIFTQFTVTTWLQFVLTTVLF